MILLSSRKQNTANNYYNTSTHRTLMYNSMYRNQTKRELYHSQTLWFLQFPTTLSSPVYRKPTHIDQYLQWDSNPLITAKNSVFNTLAHRAKVACTNQQALHKEMEHIRKALQACNFPLWPLNTLQNKFNCKHNIHNRQTFMYSQPNNNNSVTNNKKNISIVVPYIHGLGESSKGHSVTWGSRYISRVPTP